ncbi:MAG: phasin family protein [Hyphomicrobiales bacterium]|nr:phasin family protein [Hyphomicrobiales bacterium]
MATEPLSRAVPNEVRDFADRSVEQARKAFGSFMGVVNAAIESESPTAATSSEPAADLSRLALDFAERNVQGAFALAHDMVHATEVSQLLELQREFLETQMKALKNQLRTLERSRQDEDKRPEVKRP